MPEINKYHGHEGEKRMIKKKYVSIMKKTDLYDEAERRLEELSKIKQKKDDVIKNVPSGKIRVAVSGNRTQFYVRNENSEKLLNHCLLFLTISYWQWE